VQGRVILAAGLLLLVASCAPGGPSPPAAERPSGVPQADFARAVALQRQGEHARSVPFFRSAAEGEPDVSGLHAELAKALHNATLQMGFSGHGVRFAVARSQDRARMRDQALAEIQRAIDLEGRPRELSALWLIRSRIFEQCGYIADARVCVERGLELEPGEPVLTASAARLDARLRAGH